MVMKAYACLQRDKFKKPYPHLTQKFKLLNICDDCIATLKCGKALSLEDLVVTVFIYMQKIC